MAALRILSGQITHGIAAARRSPKAQVGELIDRGPLVADEAKTAGLVDRIGYRDEAVTGAPEPRRVRCRTHLVVALSRQRRTAA